MAQFIGLPQLVQDLLFLHGGGGKLRFQPAGRPFQVQEGLVHLLTGPALGGALRLQGDLLPADDGQPLRNGGALGLQFRLSGCSPGDLPLGFIDLPLVLGQGSFLLAPVPGQLRRQLPQVGGPAQSAFPVGGEGGQLRLAGSDGLGQLARLGQQFALAGEDGFRLGAAVGRFPFPLRHGLLRRRGPSFVVLHPAVDGFQFAAEIFHAFSQIGKQHIKLILYTLQAKDLVLRRPALGLGRGQFILGGVQLPLGRFLRRLGLFQLPVHVRRPAVQSFQLRRPAENAGAAAGGAAGHGAAPVDDLAVQGHNAEGVMVLPGHGDAAVQVLGNHRPAQKAVENMGIFRVEAHQPGRHAHKAEFLLHAPLPQFIAPDGGEGQEGGPAAVPLFQEGDGAFGILLPVHHDVLQTGAQGDFNGQGIFAVGFHQACHRAVDAPEVILGLADQLDGLVEALIVLFHLRQQADAVIHGAHIHGEFHPAVRQGGGLFLPLLHPQGVAADDVGGGLRLLLGILQGLAVGPGFLCFFFQLPLRSLLVRQGGHPAGLDLLRFRPDGGSLRAGICCRCGGHGLPAPKGFRLCGGAPCLFRRRPGLGQQLIQLFVQHGGLLFQFRHLCVLLRRLGLVAPGAAFRFFQLTLGPLDILRQMADGALQHRHGGILLRRPGVQTGGISPEGLRLHVLFLHPLAELLVFRKEGIHLRPGLVPLPLRVPQVDLQLPGIRFQRFQILQPQGNLQHTHLVPEDQILLRRLRLGPQRLHLEFQFRDLVVDAHQVFLGALQLPLRLLFPVAEFGDPGGLLKNLPAVGALGG